MIHDQLSVEESKETETPNDEKDILTNKHQKKHQKGKNKETNMNNEIV
jgi:hypothetical protein